MVSSMPPEASGLSENQRRWLEHLQAADQSGLTLRDYARQRGLSVKKLYSWKQDLKRRGVLPQPEARPTFVPVRFIGPNATVAVSVYLPSGVRVEVSEGVSANLLETVLACSAPTMIRPANDLPQVFLCRSPVDLRKSIDGLAALVEQTLALNPFAEHLFVFSNRRRDKLKILYWERSGFVLWYKRLERERFKWPVHLPGDVVTLTGQQLNWLLDGYDLRYLRPHRPLHYQSVL